MSEQFYKELGSDEDNTVAIVANGRNSYEMFVSRHSYSMNLQELDELIFTLQKARAEAAGLDIPAGVGYFFSRTKLGEFAVRDENNKTCAVIRMSDGYMTVNHAPIGVVEHAIQRWVHGPKEDREIKAPYETN